VVIAVDGAIQAPVAGARLRRVLVIAAIGVAGWLMSAVFAAAASAAPHDPPGTEPPLAEQPVAEQPVAEPPAAEPPAQEAPAEEPEAPTEEAPAEEPLAETAEPEGTAATEPESTELAANTVLVASAPEPTIAPAPTMQSSQQSSGGGLLGGLLGAVTNTVSSLTGALLNTTGSLLSPVVPPQPSPPIIDLPELLPATDGWTWGGSSSGSAETVRAEPVAAPTAYAVAPAAPVTPVPAATPAITHTRVTVEPAATRQQSRPASDDPTDADQAQRGSGGERLPGKVPAAPAAPAGPTATAGHDHSGGARGLHGVLVAQTALEPGDAGFTTRSRAVNAAGRAAGLPAATPD
jgi:hypothetical protein